MTRLLLAIVLALSLGSASAQVPMTGAGLGAPGGAHYVAAAGSDSNPGTQALPWQTIGKVNGYTFGASDCVYFNGGDTFGGGSAGLASSTLKCVGKYGSGTPTISSGTASGFAATNVSAINISNITFSGGGTVDGISIINNGASNIAGPTINAVTVTGYGGNCIGIFAGSSNAGFTSPTVTNSTLNGCTRNAVGNASGVTFNTGSSSVYGHTNCTITGNTVENNAGTAAQFSGNGIWISGCSGAEIANNVVHDNGATGPGSGAGPVGILATFSDSAIIEKNEVYNQFTAGNDGECLDFDWGVSNSKIQYNYAHGCAGPALLAYNFSFGSAPTWHDNQIRFNVVQQSNPSGTATGIGIGYTGLSQTGCYIYNNTIYVMASNAYGITDLGNDGGSSDCTFSNNIFYVVGAYAVRFLNFGGSSMSSLVFTGNDYYGNGQWLWANTNYTTYSAWQTATGAEKISGSNVGHQVEPRLVVYGGGGTVGGYVPASLTEYQLQPGSPSLLAGLNLNTQYSINVGSQDYFGVSVTASALPLGAGQQIASFSASCSQATTFLARTSGLNAAHQFQYNALICGMVADSNWSSLDALYKLATDTTTDAYLNLVSSSYGLTAHGSGSFSADNGWIGDGSSGYLDTGFTPSTASGNFALSSATVAAYVVNNRIAAHAYENIGGGTAGYVFNESMNGTSVLNGGANTTQATSGAVVTAKGLLTFTLNGTVQSLLSNAGVVGTNTQTATALGNSSLSIGAFNFGGVYSSYTADTLGYVAFGAGLSNLNALLFNYRINADATALGINAF